MKTLSDTIFWGILLVFGQSIALLFATSIFPLINAGLILMFCSLLSKSWVSAKPETDMRLNVEAEPSTA